MRLIAFVRLYTRTRPSVKRFFVALPDLAHGFEDTDTDGHKLESGVDDGYEADWVHILRRRRSSLFVHHLAQSATLQGFCFSDIVS